MIGVWLKRILEKSYELYYLCYNLAGYNKNNKKANSYKMGGTMKRNLYLELNQEVKVEGISYIVEGWIEFSAQSDGCSWREYRIRIKQGKQYKWLSIDENYDEYAIYEMTHKTSLFEQTALEADGYKKVDSGKASVLDYAGKVDVARGERVSFEEYEDRTEEKIRAIEHWKDETEYSIGHYLDEDDIIPLESNKYTTYNDGSYKNNSTNYKMKTRSKQGISGFSIFWLFIALTVIISGITAFTSTKTISKYLQGAANFTYVTSITSDINSQQKADVYKTSLSVQGAAENILSHIAKQVTNVDENAEGGTVAILTKKEYALVYTSEDNETLVQVSNRKYAYSSRNTPYRSRANTTNYYRRYYYDKGYTSDSKRYKNDTSGYEDYTDSSVEVDTSNHYKTYTNTIKQQSTASRSSSGGGTSSGK